MAVQKTQPNDEPPWDARGVVVIDADVSFFTEGPNPREVEDALSGIGGVRPVVAPDALSLEVAETEVTNATATALRVYTHPMKDGTDRVHWHINFRRTPFANGVSPPAQPPQIRRALEVLANARVWPEAIEAQAATTYFLDVLRYAWRGPQVRTRKVRGLGTLVPSSTSWVAGRNKRGFIGFTATYDETSDSTPFILEARGAWPIKLGPELLSEIDLRLWGSMKRLLSERK